MTNVKQTTDFLRKMEKEGMTLGDLADLIENVARSNPDFSDSNDRAKSAELSKQKIMNDESLRQEITKIMREIGIPVNIAGYEFIRYSVELTCKNPNIMRSVISGLYTTIANKFDTTPSRVDRAIRHAIDVTYNRGNVEVLYKYLGYNSNTYRGKTTNSEFIAMIADYIRMEYNL